MGIMPEAGWWTLPGQRGTRQGREYVTNCLRGCGSTRIPASQGLAISCAHLMRREYQRSEVRAVVADGQQIFEQRVDKRWSSVLQTRVIDSNRSQQNISGDPAWAGDASARMRSGDASAKRDVPKMPAAPSLCCAKSAACVGGSCFRPSRGFSLSRVAACCSCSTLIGAAIGVSAA